jgi:hypothetical protein
MNEVVPTAESQDVDPTTVDALLQRIQDMADADQGERGGTVVYPGVPRGLFRSTDADGHPIILDILQIPIDKTRRGEVALVERSRAQPGTVVPRLEKQYFFFNEGSGVALEGLEAAQPPSFVNENANPSDPDYVPLIQRAETKIRAEQTWREQQLEEQRVRGESRVHEDEAQQLLAQLSRAGLLPAK